MSENRVIVLYDATTAQFRNGKIITESDTIQCSFLETLFPPVLTEHIVRCPIEIVHDSINGIFQRIEEVSVKAGRGYFSCLDFSEVRKQGATVPDTGGIASGPLSFATVWDAAIETYNWCIIPGIALLHEDHPDIKMWQEWKPKSLITGWYK